MGGRTTLVILVLLIFLLTGCSTVTKTYSELPTNVKLRIQEEFSNLGSDKIQKYTDWKDYMKETYPEEYNQYLQTCEYTEGIFEIVVLLGIFSTVGLVILPVGIVGWLLNLFIIILNWSALVCVLA